MGKYEEAIECFDKALNIMDSHKRSPILKLLELDEREDFLL